MNVWTIASTEHPVPDLKDENGDPVLLLVWDEVLGPVVAAWVDGDLVPYNQLAGQLVTIAGATPYIERPIGWALIMPPWATESP